MIPCSVCKCHIRRDEVQCPLCGAAQLHTSDHVNAPGAMGSLAVAAALLGLAACSSRTSGADDGATVTTATATMMDTDTDTDTTTFATTTAESSNTDADTDTDTDTDTETETGNLMFVPDNDLAALYGVCDVYVQDCPEGEKCVSYSRFDEPQLDANKCVEILGDKQVGEPCTSDGYTDASDDCGPESQCWDLVEVDGKLEGTCRGFCSGTADNPSCPEGEACLVAYDGATALCVDACDPLAQDCPAGLVCDFIIPSQAFACVPSAGASVGEACAQDSGSCDAGLFCAAAEFVPMCDDACCVEYCDLANPTCTSPGTSCTSFFADHPMPPMGYDDLGVCVIP